MAAVKSIIDSGFENIVVDTECSITNGLPTLTIVGLASKSVDEAKERIRAALKASNLLMPRKRIVVNLAPADLPKDTTSLDLAIALAILAADKQIQSKDIDRSVFIGELSLDGSIRGVRGLLGKLIGKTAKNMEKIYIPSSNIGQAELVNLTNIYAVKTLRELVDDINQKNHLSPIAIRRATADHLPQDESCIDFGDIQGQEAAKRALLIAAAGGHNVLMTGPPGTGKSMLAKAFINIMPPLTPDEAVEVTHLHSLASRIFDKPILMPPLRSPHHTASNVAIIGGGNHLKPGEISLAHHGVLFLDEIPEFGRYAIESLRQPLEDAEVTISRAQNSVTFPAKFILIATCNPCPCGFLNTDQNCTCSASQINNYHKKLSGPIMDRIDLHVYVGSIEHSKLLKTPDNKQTPALLERVRAARAVQTNRQGPILNAKLNNRNIKKYCLLDNNAETLLNKAAEAIKLSPRSYMKTIKVARTIADLDKSPNISTSHITEAIQYRQKQHFL